MKKINQRSTPKQRLDEKKSTRRTLDGIGYLPNGYLSKYKKVVRR